MSLKTRVGAIILLMLGGFGIAMSSRANPERQRMIGKWEASFEMTENDMAKMTPTDNPVVSGIGKLLMKSLRADIQWEFGADDTVNASATLLGNTVTRRGTWRFLRADEQSTTLEITFENDTPLEVDFSFSSPDTFVSAPPASGKWQLNRVVKFKRVAETSHHASSS